jgi:RNA polymerase sigma-70 factor (ECF subfamily)
VDAKEESQIVEAARKGDVDSFGKLYERYYAAMVWIAHSIVAERNLAEDAAQETFTVACHELVRLERPDKFSSWLAGICRNVAYQMARRRKKEVLANDPPAVVEQSNDESLQEKVREAIGALPKAYQEALMLRYWNDMSYEQIGPILGIGISKVKGRLFRARRKVEKHLRRKGFE